MIDYATDSNSVAKTYTWGLDLSGDLQGAGGVCGLLCVTENPVSSTQSRYFPSYDANGNISEYVNESDSVVAHYEYSPFGKITSSSGSKAGNFRHRFSTKYLDSETVLYYYGYRYYSSELGRWVSRDPVEEKGGLNIYLFVGNCSVNRLDTLGLLSWSKLVDAFNEAKAAIDDAKQCMQTVRDAFERRDQGYSDKLNHCLSSCEISKDCGNKIADALGTLKEARDLSVGGIEWLVAWVIPKSWEKWVHKHIQGGSFQDSVDDFTANFTGFGCKNDPDGCECCCKKKY